MENHLKIIDGKLQPIIYPFLVVKPSSLTRPSPVEHGQIECDLQL